MQYKMLYFKGVVVGCCNVVINICDINGLQKWPGTPLSPSQTKTWRWKGILNILMIVWNFGRENTKHPTWALGNSNTPFILPFSSFRTVGKIPMDNKSCFYSPLLLPNFCYKSQTFKSFHQFHKLNQHEQQGFSLPCHLCSSVRCFVFQTTKTTCKFLL